MLGKVLLNSGRFASDLFSKGGKRIVKNLDMKSPMDWGVAIAPDIMFGGLAAGMTEGDVLDRGAAFLGSSLGGAGGGLVLRGLVPSRNPIVQMGLEIAGGIGGDIGGMTVADNFMRMRHGGYTPWEQKQLEQQALLENEILAKYLANMQGYTQDPFLVQNGLG